MMKLMFIACGSFFAIAAQMPALAQVTVDVSKITCEQYTGYKITDPQNIGMWLSGYYNGKRGNTVIDTQGMAASAAKLKDYCFTHPDVMVMQATETLFFTTNK